MFETNPSSPAIQQAENWCSCAVFDFLKHSRRGMADEPTEESKHPSPIETRRNDDYCDILRKMRSEEETCDVVFLVDGERFPAHRAWLSASSPMLTNMLNNGMKETGECEVHLPNFCASIWRETLDFVYFEKLDVLDTSHAIELLECARFYELDNMEKHMTNALVSFMDEQNCCQLVAVAIRLDCTSLKSQAMLFMAKHFIEVSKSKSFGGLDTDTMEELVSSKELDILSELDVLNAILRCLVIHGHRIDDDLLSEYLSDASNNQDLTSEPVDTDELMISDGIIERFTQHILLADLVDSD